MHIVKCLIFWSKMTISYVLPFEMVLSVTLQSCGKNQINTKFLYFIYCLIIPIRRNYVNLI